MLLLYPLTLLFFPKGGIKIHDLPITWGYLLLSLSAFVPFHIRLEKKHLIALAALLPFQMIILWTLAIHGSSHAGYLISIVGAFFYFPLYFFLLCPLHLIERKRIEGWIRNGVNFIALYGLFLFIFKQLSGEFFEIPYLTINGADAGMLADKCINRSAFFKLISTYNNGNLYGVCLLMLLPLYRRLETRPLFYNLVYLSLLLTLSRTVWIGLFFAFIFLERPTKLLVASLLVFAIAIIVKFPLAFFLDANLGGRLSQFDVLQETTLFATKPFLTIVEVVYVGVVESFGAVGLIAFLIAMITPLTLITDKAIRVGLLTYLLVSLSDGGMLFIPTMVFYWFLAAFGSIPDQQTLPQYRPARC